LPDEPIRHIIRAQTGVHPYLGTLFGWLSESMVRRLVVAVTDDSVIVFASTMHGVLATDEVRRLPRHTRLGPVRGVWSRINIGEDRAWVHLQFHRTVRAADAALPT
jgi:hypothetical protein